MTDIKNAAASLFEGKNGDKMKAKLHDIEDLANTPDGKAVEALLQNNGDALTKALETGDAQAMQSALKDILSTQSGRNIIDRLTQMMK